MMKPFFSIRIYFLVVLLCSWPFQFWYVFKAETAFDKYLFSSIAMLMVLVATYIAARYIFKDGFANAGWYWGKPVHYLLVILFALFIWLLPVLAEIFLGISKLPDTIEVLPIITVMLAKFVGTLLPAFGEEFGWRGYMLPRLAEQYGARKGLLIHAFIWWLWHLPVIIGIGLGQQGIGGNQWINVMLVSLVSIIPSMMHAIVFAFIWTKSRSIFVVTVYHAAFDEVRDTLESAVGFGALVNNWQMLVIIIAGAMLWWKANWNRLLFKNAYT